MILTLMQYLSNPHGKGAVTSQMKLVKDSYDDRYDNLLAKHGSFATKIYKARSSFYIHIKIPSETYEKVVYDIVIKFSKVRDSSETSLRNWAMSVMCNTPSFVFTYASVFRKNRILIDELKFILEKKSYTKPPETRNPYDIVGFEKTLYYACKYIRDKRYDYISNIEGSVSKPYKVSELRKNLVEFTDIMDLIDKEQARMSLSKKKEKREKERSEKNLKNIILSDRKQNMNAGTSSTVNKTSSVRKKVIGINSRSSNRVRSVRKK